MERVSERRLRLESVLVAAAVAALVSVAALVAAGVSDGWFGSRLEWLFRPRLEISLVGWVSWTWLGWHFGRKWGRRLLRRTVRRVPDHEAEEEASSGLDRALRRGGPV